MRVKKVNRYYCDFCKKAGCAGGHIRKHEERCTKNPNRICGMCKMLGRDQPKLQDLLDILPNPKEYEDNEYTGEFMPYHSGLAEDVDKLLPQLRKLTNNCPACIMAALRQKGIPIPLVRNFNFANECKDIWTDINEANLAEDYPY